MARKPNLPGEVLLEEFLRTTSEFWLNLQKKVDLYEAEQKLKGLKLKLIKAS